MSETHLFFNVDSRSQPIEVIALKYDKKTGKMELLCDRYICDQLLEARNLLRSYIKRLENLKSVTVDSDLSSRGYLTDLRMP